MKSYIIKDINDTLKFKKMLVWPMNNEEIIIFEKFHRCGVGRIVGRPTPHQSNSLKTMSASLFMVTL